VYVTWIIIPVVAGLTAGCILYWFRCRTPFYYGLGEIVAALVLLVLVFDPQTSYLLLEEDSPFFSGSLENRSAFSWPFTSSYTGSTIWVGICPWHGVVGGNGRSVRAADERRRDRHESEELTSG